MWHIILVEDAKEQCPLEDYFESIVDLKLKAKILRDIDLLEEFGTELGLPHSKIIKTARGNLYELRTKQSSNISRIFYQFASGNRIILLNGFIKKTNKISKQEIIRAYQLLNIWKESNHDKVLSESKK